MSFPPGRTLEKRRLHRNKHSVENVNGNSVGRAENQNEGESVAERSFADEARASKAERSNQARLRSMEARNMAWRRRREVMQEAAKKVPRKSKEVVAQERKSDNTNGGPTLFDDGMQEAGVSWPDTDISEAKTRMLLQQGKIGSDPRFRMNDLFLPDFVQENDNEHIGLDETTDESKRQMSIAEKIADSVAPSRSKPDAIWNSSSSAKKSHCAKTFPIGVRYDPDNPSHQQFELQPSPSTSHVNAAENGDGSDAPVNNSSVTEQTVAPKGTQVMVDPEFSERLKASEWNDSPTEEFSLLAAFGRTEVQEVSNEGGQLASEDFGLNAALLEVMSAQPKNEAAAPASSSAPKEFKSAAPKKKGEKFLLERSDRRIIENMKRFRHKDSIDNLRKCWADEQLTFRATYKRRWREAHRKPRNRAARS
ncbi:hypothetical protein M514_06760 [Trichuris suis]|uniref:Uncharacterized protein n=1 Tax=Trichuris suis TaxID=68888 RepID=A0A085NKG4_9BILA|nr:hypothetical protein M513_06760 [Trichuris suis]KFD69960.1 hypothetical protein M514_06760 [Trichuris suis]